MKHIWNPDAYTIAPVPLISSFDLWEGAAKEQRTLRLPDPARHRLARRIAENAVHRLSGPMLFDPVKGFDRLVEVIEGWVKECGVEGAEVQWAEELEIGEQG